MPPTPSVTGRGSRRGTGRGCCRGTGSGSHRGTGGESRRGTGVEHEVAEVGELDHRIIQQIRLTP